MRNGILAALTVLVADHALAFAQVSNDPRRREPPPTTAGLSAVARPDVSLAEPRDTEVDVEAEPGCSRFYASGEYLLWWFKTGHVPSLVTAGGNGVLGSPGTQVLVDNLNFDEDVRQGGRFVLGYQFASAPYVGVEVGYFFVADRQSEVRFASDGNPILTQPFISTRTGGPDATRIAEPGIAMGSVIVAARTSLWGAEANLTADVLRSDMFHLTAVGGFRFLRLPDEVTSAEQFKVAPSVPGFGGRLVDLRDEFHTDNRFYGGQVGLVAGARFGRLTIDLGGKLALGQMQQFADVSGGATGVAPGRPTIVLDGGLYALQSNIGRYQRDELAFSPEVDLNLGLQLTNHWKVYAGYSFIWVSTVARAGEQIDPVINPSNFPIRSGNGPVVQPAQPAFHLNGTDFGAQGLNFGLELRY